MFNNIYRKSKYIFWNKSGIIHTYAMMWQIEDCDYSLFYKVSFLPKIFIDHNFENTTNQFFTLILQIKYFTVQSNAVPAIRIYDAHLTSIGKVFCNRTIAGNLIVLHPLNQNMACACIWDECWRAKYLFSVENIIHIWVWMHLIKYML